MKCPMYYAQLREQENGSISDRGNCLDEECAWWSQKYGRCAILSCIGAAEKLDATLKHIASKITIGGTK